MDVVFGSQVVHMLESHLQPGTGLALIAAKRYYFGTGGSTEEFRSLLSSSQASAHGGFSCEVVEVVDNGRSNIREILAVSKGGGQTCMDIGS